MSQAEELISMLLEEEGTTDNKVSVRTVNHESEGHIIVGDDRFITIPDELKRVAVQYDHNIETVTFDCPKYWDGHDLSTMKLYINYIRPDGRLGSALAKNIVDGDTIFNFDWVVSRDVTELNGRISFLVCAKTINDAGEEELHWNSEISNDMYISQGIELDGSFIESYPEIIESLLYEYSASVSIEPTENGTTITIKDKNGDKTFTVLNGADGVSPSIQVTPLEGENGATISITDANGTTSVDLYGDVGPEGPQGPQGPQGPEGPPGKPIGFNRIEVPTSGWSVSETNLGYLENILTIDEVTIDTPIWGIAEGPDNALPTEEEENAFNSVDYLITNGTTAIFYAKVETAPSTFYVYIQNKEE